MTEQCKPTHRAMQVTVPGAREVAVACQRMNFGDVKLRMVLTMGLVAHAR